MIRLALWMKYNAYVPGDDLRSSLEKSYAVLLFKCLDVVQGGLNYVNEL